MDNNNDTNNLVAIHKVVTLTNICTSAADLGWSLCHDGIKARLFGEMAKLATAELEQYHSDLFHDAMWIERNVTGPTQFRWSFDKWGTWTLPYDVAAHSGRDVKYVIRLFNENQCWKAEFTPDTEDHEVV